MTTFARGPGGQDPLSPDKRKLFERLLQQKGIAVTPREPIGPRQHTGEVPLSFAQQRLWFLEQLVPGSPLYTLALALHLTGALHPQALIRSLNEIVRRHEILRTRYVKQMGDPIQVILPQWELDLPLVDLIDIAGSTCEAEAERLIRQYACLPFDLAARPPVRACLFRLDAYEHTLVFCLHHIAADAWSGSVLLQELAALYAAYHHGEASPLPALPLQYADYALWQREQAGDRKLTEHVKYWQHALAGAPEVLELPGDHPRPPVQGFAGAIERFTVPPVVVDSLRQLSTRAGATLFMTLLAAFGVLLQRTSAQNDLIIGVPVANRANAEIERLIGFFVNMLPLRLDLSGDPGFIDLLERVRTRMFEAFAHQEAPFEQVVEAVQPARTLSHTPLFQISFALQNVPRPSVTLCGVTMALRPVDTGMARFDLSLQFVETVDGLAGTLEYSTDLFAPQTAQRLVSRFQMLLAGIAARPEARLSELPLMTDTERQQMLVVWNDTTADYPHTAGTSHLFEAQARQTPDAVAIVCEEAHLTYAELDRRGNQLAHYLHRLGVGTETRVGVCLERSLETTIALLGIWKAGGAYVPLDPQVPSERLSSMLADAQAVAVLTHSSLAHRMPTHECAVLSLDTLGPELAREPTDTPGIVVQPNNLAYIIYTSGSTGAPKGVEISHSGLLNLIAWHQRAYAVNPGSRASHLAGPGFDAAVWELWPYLTAGASVHVVTGMLSAQASALAGWLVRQRITHAFVPTPLAGTMLRDYPNTWPAQSSLTFMLTGGDVLHQGPAQRLPFMLVNHYGPTEGTVVATCAPVSVSEVMPPIGRPIANATVYVLDAQLQPVPMGVPGELYIGGVGLARGYLHRPELTAARFVPDPFATTPGERLYRTGDLARWRANGQMEFLGRVDQQVKLRGFRIELGEIEAVLGRHPAVGECAVILHRSTPGEENIVAYVTARANVVLDTKELRQFLREKLPDYMVPSGFAVLPALPLTPSGKVDRRNLPPPEKAVSASETYIAPQTETERAIAQIWADVLHVERVGLADNFFEIGGHSLLATQVLGRIQETLHVELPLRTFFEAPTVAELATALTQREAEDMDDEQLATLLAQLEQLSDSETRAQLAIRERATEIESETRGVQ